MHLRSWKCYKCTKSSLPTLKYISTHASLHIQNGHPLIWAIWCALHIMQNAAFLPNEEGKLGCIYTNISKPRRVWQKISK